MKITRSQKEAVIDLLKEKLNEKEASEKEKFIKKNQKAIDAELEKNILNFVSVFMKLKIVYEI